MSANEIEHAHALALMEGSPVGFLVLDEGLHAVWMNPATARIMKVDLAAARGRALADVLPPLETKLAGVFREVFETGLPFLGLEMRAAVEAPGHGARWIVSAFPLHAVDRRIGVAIVETSDREQVEVREREALFRVVFEHAAVGMLVLDWRDQGLRMNAALQEVLGYTVDELVHIGIQGITHPDDFAADLGLFRQLMAGERDHYRLVKRYLKKGGAVIWADLTVSLARDARGQPELIISMIQDISERKRAEDERDALLAERTRLLARAEEGLRVRDVFLAMAAHELKTPLTPLKLDVDGLVADLGAGPLTDRSRHALARVERQIERLEHLVDDLLDVARMDRGELRIVREAVDLAQVAAEVAARFQLQAQRAGAPLAMRAPAHVHGAWDRGRLDQVVSNLLSNALKFGAGAPIELEVGEEGGVARLVVRDHGVGIAPEAHEKIFERFERAVSGRHYAGLGLGLWICRQIVTAHGGRIRVESTPGVGATFVVELPAGAPGV